MNDDQMMRLCDTVRETGYALHRFLGPGYREKVYERGLAHRLRKQGLAVETQPTVKVFDEDGTELTEDQLDLVIQGELVVELKAISATTNTDVAQLHGYLKATRFRHGLLINFGAEKFQIKKYVK